MNFNISMWNIHTWLNFRSISHVSSIRSNENSITRVRLDHAEGCTISCAAVSPAPEHTSYTAVISCYDDRIYLHQLSPEEVVDEINRLFVTLNIWQQNLKRTNLAYGTCGELLSLSASLLPYPILLFRGDTLLAYSPDYESECLRLWNEFHSLSLEETLLLTQKNADSNRPYNQADPVLTYSPLIHGRQVLIHTIEISGGQFWRFAAFALERPLSPGDIHLIRELGNAIVQNQNLHQQRIFGSSFHLSSFFYSCAAGKEPDPSQSERVGRWLGWNPAITVFRFELLKSQDSILLDKLQQFLSSAFRSSVCLQLRTAVLLILPISDSQISIQQVVATVKTDCFLIGQSNISPDFSLLPELMHQARKSLETARKQGLPYLTAQDTILDSIHQILRDNNELQALVHPAIRRLQQLDEKESRIYIEALKTYLHQGGNCNAAAKTLGIHRNTLLHRLDQIEEMTNCMLNDPQERESLLLSLLLIS